MKRHAVPAILLIAAWLMFLPGAFLQSGQVTVERYSHEHGIAGPVKQIARDSFGFIWLGTLDGLVRYDGRHFMRYRNDPADPSSLSNNIINDLYVDHKNRVWVTTNRGICYFDHEDGVFHHIAFNNRLERIDRHRVHNVCEAHKGGIWFTTRSILHHWNERSVTSFYPVFTSDDLSIYYLYDDGKGRVWMGTNSGITLFREQDSSFLHHQVHSPFSIEKGLSVTVHPFVPLSGDTLLAGSWYGGLQKVYFDGKSIISIPVIDHTEINQRKNVVDAIGRKDERYWWIGSFGAGLSVWDQATGSFVQHIHHDPADIKSLGSDYIHALYPDPSGILWIGTEEGLDKYDPFNRQFRAVNIPFIPDEFSVYRRPSAITGDIHDPDYLWISLAGAGLFRYDTRHQTFRQYTHSASDPYSLPDNAVYSLYYDDKMMLWIGTRSGLYLYDPVSKKFTASPVPSDRQPREVHAIFQDRKKRYWFATRTDGFCMYDHASGDLVWYRNDPGNAESLPDNRVFCLAEDHKGYIWVGTQNRGACRLDPEDGRLELFFHDKNIHGSLPDNSIFKIYEDENQVMWFATENGLAKMDSAGGLFHTYTTNDGLCHNIIYMIYPDHEGYLWLATQNGLSRFDPVRRTFKNYYTHDGLPSNTISRTMYLAADGTLYFCASGVLGMCSPAEMKINERIPEVMLTRFRIFDREHPLRREGRLMQPIHLSYRENMVTFEFAALNFTHPELNTYAYTLEGLDEQWIDNGHRTSATYTNLSGGTYTFRVKAANNDGIWSDSPTSVTVIVHPPYWHTWWFYLVCAVVMTSMLYGLYRFRIYQLMRLQQIRMRISRDLHDDIGSTLSSINMMSSMAAQAAPEKAKSLDLFHTISSASRQAMDLMSDIVWSIHPGHDRMETIVIRMRQYASEMLEAAQIAFTIDMDEAASQVSLAVEKRKDFYLIYKEAINNLAKYAAAKNAVIRMKLEGRSLVLSITDDGRGFDPAASFTGNGIKNMRARAAQLKGSLAIASSPGGGTVITLRLPLTP